MRTSQWLVLAGLLIATTASAQKEQWLQYHTSRDGRGFRHLELTTNAPADVALPKFNAQPYFAKWTTPMEPKPRWICFDRTRKSGPYDLVYIDSKGDGRLDDKTPTKASRIDQFYSFFDSVRLVFKGEDGPITYHLGFQFMKYESGSSHSVNLYARSDGYYEGQVDLGNGKKKRIELVDSNVNGTFNDLAADPGGCDCVAVEGDKTSERYLGKLLEIGEDIYRIEVARDGAFVKLQKATDLTFGTVRVPESITEFVAFGENGHFVRKSAKGEFKLPAGKYQIHEWTITRKDSRGSTWTMAGSDFPEAAKFTAAESKPVTLDIGEPVRAVMSQDNGISQVAFDLSFKGKLNETISIRKGEQNPPAPKLTLASQDRTFCVTNTFEFG
jgi:hypothetical protein